MGTGRYRLQVVVAKVMPGVDKAFSHGCHGNAKGGGEREEGKEHRDRGEDVYRCVRKLQLE